MCNSKFMELSGTRLLGKKEDRRRKTSTGTPAGSRMNQEIHDGTEALS
jgi:hypothetical protein